MSNNLKVILEFLEIPHVEMAEKLGLTRQAFNYQLKTDNPIKYNKQISELLGIDENLITKEDFTEIDKLTIRLQQVEKKLEETCTVIPRTIVDVEGTEWNFDEKQYDENLLEEKHKIEIEIQQVELFEKIKTVFPLEKCQSDIESYKYQMFLLDVFIDILENNKIELLTLQSILGAISKYYLREFDKIPAPDMKLCKELMEVFAVNENTDDMNKLYESNEDIVRDNIGHASRIAMQEEHEKFLKELREECGIEEDD